MMYAPLAAIVLGIVMHYVVYRTVRLITQMRKHDRDAAMRARVDDAVRAQVADLTKRLTEAEKQIELLRPYR